MKKYLLIAIMAVCFGCGDEYDKEWNKNHETFELYIDSSRLASSKFSLHIKKDNLDSAFYFYSKSIDYWDSAATYHIKNIDLYLSNQ